MRHLLSFAEASDSSLDPIRMTSTVYCYIAGSALKIQTIKTWCSRNRIAISTTCTVIPISIGLYCEWGALKKAGFLTNFNDTIQAAGQFATVGAFWIAFQQLRKSKEDAAAAVERENQLYFLQQAEECLENMLVEVKNFNPEKAYITTLIIFLNKLINLAVTFKKRSENVTAPLQLRVIATDWQKMYFGELLPRLRAIDIFKLLQGSSHMEGIHDSTSIRQYAYEHAENGKHPQQLLYFYICSIATPQLLPHLPATIQNTLPIESGVFYLFKHYFFDEDSIGRLLPDDVGQIDIRVQAPAIAALYEQYADHISPLPLEALL